MGQEQQASEVLFEDVLRAVDPLLRRLAQLVAEEQLHAKAENCRKTLGFQPMFIVFPFILGPNGLDFMSKRCKTGLRGGGEGAAEPPGLDRRALWEVAAWGSSHGGGGGLGSAWRPVGQRALPEASMAALCAGAYIT